VEEFYQGIRSLALGVSLVGGDTSVAKSLFISTCLVGDAPYPPITRGGAQVGDDIYVTGTLGDSALGLKLLKQKSPSSHNPRQSFFYRDIIFRLPGSKLELHWREKLARAMIDVSDGLLQDLDHICKASRTGAVLAEESYRSQQRTVLWLDMWDRPCPRWRGRLRTCLLCPAA
jgi:thiamine-monophosphate kinase